VADDDDDTADDDDDATADDDDVADDDTGGDDDDTGGDDDDTVGDDDTTNPFTCTDFCAMEGGGLCIDWAGSGMTCMEFCEGCLNQADLDCLSTCPPSPYTDGCACIYSCLAAYLNP